MSAVFVVLLVIAMLLVLGSLGIGMFYMTRPSSPEQMAQSNKWMRIRVTMQGIALLLFALAVLSGK